MNVKQIASLVKFRLSTVLLLIVVAAITLGWLADRTTRYRRAIVGEWYYPTNDVGDKDYSSLLRLRADGTFTKIQGTIVGQEKFDGTYQFLENGSIRFHITSKTEIVDVDELGAQLRNSSYEPALTELDAKCICRCALDPAGYLVIRQQEIEVGIQYDLGINWETHARDTDYYVRGRGE